mgnify:FL=1|tara:strand:+ start:13560 stop:14321 length:762 start_codon:yes stop_codon:yes gene_type:complete
MKVYKFLTILSKISVMKILVFIICGILVILNYGCSDINSDANKSFNARLAVSGDSSDPFYGKKLCHNSKYKCIKIYKKDTWENLFKDKNTRQLVMDLNRTNMPLKYRDWIIIPKDINNSHILYSPFPQKVSKTNKKKIVISISKQAYAAYDSKGNLLRWGAANTGAEDGERNTPLGKFKIYRKKGATCQSSKYPIPKGGSPMPYCIFFHKGYAIHAFKMPGFPVSLGCVRVGNDDAKWLHQFSPIGIDVIVEA